MVKALQVIDRVSDSPDTREEYTKTAMLLAQTDNPDDPRVKKIVRKRITSPCSKQKEKPAQSELAKGFTAVLPGGG